MLHGVDVEWRDPENNGGFDFLARHSDLEAEIERKTFSADVGQTRLYNRVGWASTYLKKAGLLQALAPGRFQLTDRGSDILSSQPASIDVPFCTWDTGSFRAVP